MNEFLGSLLWLIVGLLALLPLQDWVAMTLSGILLGLTRRPRVALSLYFALFLPGILLHEGSHWLAALVLGARPRGVSLRPVPLRDGRVRLGYVETGRTDPVRAALIGVAPLAAGSIALLLIGFVGLHLDDLAWAAQRGAWWNAREWLRQTLQSPYAALWIYLAMTIGQTMLPSRSDRQAWLPIALIAVVGAGIILWTGVGPHIAIWLLPPAAAVLRTLASAFTLTIALDLALSPFLILLARLLLR